MRQRQNKRNEGSTKSLLLCKKRDRSKRFVVGKIRNEEVEPNECKNSANKGEM